MKIFPPMDDRECNIPIHSLLRGHFEKASCTFEHFYVWFLNVYMIWRICKKILIAYYFYYPNPNPPRAWVFASVLWTSQSVLSHVYCSVYSYLFKTICIIDNLSGVILARNVPTLRNVQHIINALIINMLTLS